MANTVEVVIQAKDEASGPIKNVGASLGDLESKGHSAGGALGGLGSVLGTVASVGFAAVGAATVGVVAGIGGAVNSAADFQAAMSGVGAVAGASASELAGLSQKALALGMDTTLAGVNASDAAKAMEELASGGVSVADIMGGAAYGALQLASAGGIDVASAASIAALAMKDFGLAGSDLPHIADLFAAAANSSAVTVTDLGVSLQYVGPIAKTMGISIEELTGTLAELGDKGIKGSQAGTALRGMISNLAAPTAVQTGVMKDLNLQFFDSEGKMKNVAGIAQELHDKLGGLTDQQRTAALAQLFGNEGLTAAQILYDGGAAAVQDYTNKVNVAGAASANGTLRNDNLKGSLAALGGVWETLTISVGTAFIPAIRGATDGLTGFLTNVMPIVTAALPGLVAGIQSVIGVALRFGTDVVGAVMAVVGAFRALFSGQTNFGQFVGGIETMVGAILGRLGELAGRAAPYLGQFFSAIGTAISTYGPQVVAQFQVYALRFVEWLQTTAIPWLLPRLGQFLGAITTWLAGTALPAVAGALVALGSAFGDWVGTRAVPWVRANLPGWWAAVETWVTGTAIPAAVATLVGLGTAFGDWVATKAVPWVRENLPGWWDAIAQWVVGTGIPAAVATLEGLGQAFGDWVATKAVPAVAAALPLWGATIVHWVDTTKDSIAAGIETLAKAMGEWVKAKATPQIEADMPGWVAAITKGVDQANDGVSTGTDRLAKTLGGWVLKATPDLTSGLAAHIGLVVGAMAGWEFLVAAAGIKLGTAITDWAGAPAQAQLVTNLNGLANAISTWILTSTFFFPIMAYKLGTVIIQGIYDGVKGKWPEVEGWFAGLPGRVTAAVGDMASALYQKGVDAIQGLINGILSMSGGVAGAIGSVTQLIPGGIGQLLNQHSPSLLLMGMGSDAIEGLIIGIRGRADDVTATTYGIGTGLLGGLTTAIDAGNADLQKKIADTISAVSKAVQDALAATRALGLFDPASGPSGAQLGGFTGAVTGIVASIAEAAAQFSDKALKAATDFADAAGKVFGFFANALAGMKALPDLVVPTFADVHAFAVSVGMIVQEIQWVGTAFKEEGLKQATDFADAAGKVLGIVTNGLAAIKALAAGEIKDVPFAAVHSFALSVGMIVQELGWVATFFKEQGLAQTAVFADTAGKVLGLIANGVKAIQELPNITDPGFPAVHLFATVVATIVQELGNVATFFKQEGLTQAAAFATAGGTILGMISNGVAGIMALNTLVEPSKKAIDNFLIVVFYIVGRFADAASRLSTEGIAATTAFSNAAQAALAATKEGTDAFKSFEKLVVPSKEAIDHLVTAINYVVQQIGIIAGQMTDQGIARTNAFATMTQNVVKGITDTLDLFKKLMEAPYKTMLADGMKAVTDQMNIATNSMQTLSNDSSHFLSMANNFADNMRQAAGAIRDGLAAGAAAGGASLPGLPSGPSGGDGGIKHEVPHMASGGIVTRPTFALIGEAGPEAVVPLSRASGLGGGGGESHVHIYLDGKQITEVVYQGLLGKKRNNTSLGLA